MKRTIAAMSGRLARVIFAFALLAAQQAALAHQVWHLAAQGREALVAAAAEEAGAKLRHGELCDFHSALDTVLGVAGVAAAVRLPGAAPDVPYSAPLSSAISLVAPAPGSRDPPLRA